MLNGDMRDVLKSAALSIGKSKEVLRLLNAERDATRRNRGVQALVDSGRRLLRSLAEPTGRRSDSLTFTRPLLVHWKESMLQSRCFPEHCRTPPGNPPRP